MIFRQFDLASETDLVDEILKNPRLMTTELNVGCTETGYTTLILKAQRAPEPIKRTRERRFRRFVLYGGSNEELNQILEDEKTRLIKRYDFFTENGVIIVIDYETIPEG